MYAERATCIRRHVFVDICIRIQVARPGYMYPGDMCPGVNAALLFYQSDHPSVSL